MGAPGIATRSSWTLLWGLLASLLGAKDATMGLLASLLGAKDATTRGSWHRY